MITHLELLLISSYLVLVHYEISQQIRTIDFMPSILELLHIPLDKNYSNLDGESLLPLIKGQKVSEKIAYSETGKSLRRKENLLKHLTQNLLEHQNGN